MPRWARVEALLALVAVLAVAAALPAAAGPQVTRPFDAPEHPYGPGHRGVDLAAAPGDPVSAVLAGTVSFAGLVAGQGWVTVDHGGGLETTYGLLEPRRVVAGDRVQAGDVLGLLARSATHLDWGARRDDAYVDPLTLLSAPRRVVLVHPDAALPVLAVSPLAVAPPGGGATGSARLTWPVRGRISSGFGTRRHPITGILRMHAGLDVAAQTGTPVVAAADGVVSSAGSAGGYGLLVVLAHGRGLTTRYAHLSRITVRTGQRVARGHAVGAVGSTGASTGPHLHFEVRIGGAATDPLAWLP